MKINALSLFCGGGIGELDFNKTNINVVTACELLKTRCKFYKFFNPKTELICGDITDAKIKNKIIKSAKKQKVDFVIATPPCQGASLIGKNKDMESMKNDLRNYLIFHAIDVIEKIKPSFILFENVPRFYSMEYFFNGKQRVTLIEILKHKFGQKYNIKYSVFSSEEYGIPQVRKRGIIRMWKKGTHWDEPKKEKIVTVRQAIGSLPSLESGQKSKLRNHKARIHTPEHILCMQHTPTGHSALENKVYFPKTKNGKKVKGFSATFKRIEWDKPAPTITMRNDCISSQSNVHPGRKLKNGLYSDARVLTLREIFILSSIDPDLNIPDFVSEAQVRYMVGEGIPPKLLMKIVKGVRYE